MTDTFGRNDLSAAPTVGTVMGSRTRSRTSTTGLHGHPLAANMARVAVAEVVGTFMLVLTIVGTAIGATLAKPVAGAPYGSLAVPLAGGIVLAIVVAGLGHVSGAHFNPAVTLGLAVNRRFPWRFVPAYIAAQFVGAVIAALAAWGLYGGQARSVAHLGATYPAPGVSVGSAFAAEAVVTFMLVLVVISVATDNRAPAGVAAMAIGAALAAAILISGPLTGAGVNPARAIGPMIVAGKFTDWWVYLVAPLVGGIAAATVYERVLRPGSTPTRS
ncbi:MAG: family channel protein [Nocardioides sp.]|nr:family channel protein [Nocardioides sp.]